MRWPVEGSDCAGGGIFEMFIFRNIVSEENAGLCRVRVRLMYLGSI